MKLQTLCCILLLAGVVNCQTFNETEKEFEKEFNKLYLDQGSEDLAAKTLAAAEKQINEENALFKAGLATFSEKLTELSDIPKDEFEKEKEGAFLKVDNTVRGLGAVLPDKSEWYTHPDLEDLYQRQSTAPASFDGTAKGVVTSVKNQMSCGSCAAFAATGAHETCMLMSGARFNGLDLSEQQLIDCGYDHNWMDGCDGADSGAYGQFFASSMSGQSGHEVTYPYLDTNPKLVCPTGVSTYNSGAYVASPMPDYYCTEDKLKTLVSTYGAAVSYIYASDTAFGNYGTGVFNGCTSKQINHAILVVGYGTDPTSGLDYWLVKNSWGTSWGASGYIKIQRGNNQCGIGNFCYAAKCAATTGPISDPPDVPLPPPIPANQKCDLNKYFPGITGGPYTLTFTSSLGKFVSSVNCENGVCNPAVAGPSNCCMYICGELTC